MSEFAKYPSCKYHRDKKPVTVNNAEEDEALGPGWEDSPARFKAEKQKKEAEQAGIQRRYHERFDAARNDGDQQGLILREYASSYPEVASTDPWYLRMLSLIPALQAQARHPDKQRKSENNKYARFWNKRFEGLHPSQMRKTEKYLNKAGLTIAERDCYYLKVGYGKTFAEIASRMGYTHHSTAQEHYRKAKAKVEERNSPIARNDPQS